MLKNTKSRIILLIIVIVLTLVGIFVYFDIDRKEEKTSVSVGGAPAVTSIPGAPGASTAYKAAIETQNVKQAQIAAKTAGESAVPTLVEPTYQGAQTFVGSQTGPCSQEELKKARAAGVRAEELRCKGCTADQLKTAGFTAGELKETGFTVDQLKKAGYTPQQLKAAGLKESAEIIAASKVEFSKQPGFPKDCSPESLKKALAANISPNQIKQTLNCNIRALKDAGFTDDQFRKSGLTAGELKEAGYTAKQLRDAGFTPEDLREAGFTAAQMKEAGFTADDLKKTGYSRGDLLRAGFTPEDLKETSPLSENFPKDCSPESLRRAHVANVPLSEIKKALGCSTVELRNAGFEEEEKLPSKTEKTVPENLAGEIPSIPPDKQAQFLSELRKRQAEQMSDQQRRDAMKQLQQAMASQASDLLASWTPPPTQSFVLVPDEKTLVEKKGTSLTSDSLRRKGPVIKAGTVLFGVLDTGINSDQDSPILATIIQGELKGARLIGNFVRRDEKVLISFRTINIPTVKNSIGVNAVAIDPEEARTALASRVDNHYLLRYGTLFASSFLSGLSSAIIQSGSSVATNANTGIVIQNTQRLNTGEKALVALGNVGQQYASVLGRNFTKPPTVFVDAGVGIGVLLMQDLAIPEDEQQLDFLLAKEEAKEKEQRKEERQDLLDRLELQRREYRERRGSVVPAPEPVPVSVSVPPTGGTAASIE